MNSILKVHILVLYLITIAFVLSSCNKEPDTLKGDPELSFVQETIPMEALSSAGGSFSLDVEWAFTQWNINGDSVKEGTEFIEQISPTYAGATDEGHTITKVTIRVKENETYTTNKQVLTLRSLNSDIRHHVEIVQSPRPVEPIEVTVDPTITYQTISGFGGAAIWHALPLSDSHIRTLLGTGDNELGLSIVRVRISPVSSRWSSQVSMLQEMETYGVKIIASPWSPPGEWKYDTQENPLINGYLMEEHYDDYAIYLNDYVQYMADQNIVIDVVSVQNEPDWTATYESCEWTPQMMYNFIKNHAAAIENAKVLAAESLRFAKNYTDDILNDPIAAANLDIVGGHLYGAEPGSYPLAEEKEKEIWMTEYLLNSGSGDNAIQPEDWVNVPDSEIWDESMEMLGSIHESMISNWHAYIWWYMKRYYSFIGDGNGGTVAGEVLKRGLAFSHFSKYVRPGYVRIATETDTNAGLKLTAYTGDDKTVIVLINEENNILPEVKLQMPATPASANAYTTSLTMDGEKVDTGIGENTIALSLAPLSVTTIVIDN